MTVLMNTKFNSQTPKFLNSYINKNSYILLSIITITIKHKM